MTAETPEFAIEYDHGVVAIDSGLDRDLMCACYLLECDGAAAVIETGVNSSAPRIIEVIEARGWRREQVRHVIVTHVHLDHAGGAGALMHELPGAELLVHPRGARHMIDPSRLEASVRMVYGDEEYDRSYGVLRPIAAERVRQVTDGERVTIGGRELLFRDTPGHARHHFCVWDAASRGWFTGDTFGVSYRELDTASGPFVFPTTTPVQFDPPALKRSIALLLASDPRWMYLTHYGRVGDIERLSRDMLRAIDVLVEIAGRHATSERRTEDIRDDMRAWLVEAIRGHGVDMPDDELQSIIEPDIVLNTQGIEFWLDQG